MLPSRPTLRGWDPGSLATAGSSVTSAGEQVENATRGVETDCEQLPDLKGWSGKSHDAAVEMFGRTRRYSADLADYATDIGNALSDGSTRIGNARSNLLNKADEIDQGELHVSDQWVVLIKPAQMSAEKAAALKKQAEADQTTVNQMLLSVGSADNDTAHAMETAAQKHGYDPNSFVNQLIPPAGDEVPNPSTIPGVLQQQSILATDMGTQVRDHQESVDQDGTKTITLTMQDGSKQVETDFWNGKDPSQDASKENVVRFQHFDPNGKLISTTTSWKDHIPVWDHTSKPNSYTVVQWPNGTSLALTQTPDGGKVAEYNGLDGESHQVPYEWFSHPLASSTGGLLTGLDREADHDMIPFVKPGTAEDIGAGSRFLGPALGIAMTGYDMAFAKDPHEMCVAGISGALGTAGAWGGGALFGTAGIESGPLDVALTTGGSMVGEQLFGWIGNKIGNAVCP